MTLSMWLRLTASLMWAFTVIVMLVKNNRSARILYRLDALAQASLLALLAESLHQNGLWFSAVLVVLVKVIVVPYVMHTGSYAVERDYSAQSRFGMAFVLIISLAVTILGFLLGDQFHGDHPITQGILWAAWLVAFVQMTLRYEIWSEAWGLLNFEVITSTLAIVLVSAFPLIPDILADGVAIGMALLLSVYMALMRAQYDSVDVRKAGELKG
ncbi:Hydrogenase-4 membrane subunit HyfE [Sulfobacillus thermosulfidooxidans DSM 9293]|uniref:Hydrogenase-4 membrane subunit HyfE n=1 Tax=Sulfobacillus thermosulfidooxidans (strain DSM 9293 / VKM B-1269 / AT-1) TaxID=929705 RepID=A0A1W1W7Y6_SULTA|nr:hypothetical protein [Sulfobacillus thermosulfidooxidans]SMC02396.1 Hydrogenase-4 membrane subunit HyfE [Sulfobacillus thermosulfidooxidans DSM 9293]